MKKHYIATLGCRTNQYESQLFADQLRKLGYEAAVDEEADLCIINTCSVTDQADTTSRRQIRTIARKHKNARLIVTGCMAESSREAILAIDPRIEIVPNKDKKELISNLFINEKIGVDPWIERFDGHTRAFVKVQDGCNSFCSYCIVPYTRGRSRSRSKIEIMKEIGVLVANGYREIVLTGINVGDYDSDGDSLADLVNAVDQMNGVERVRISSIDPSHLNQQLVDVLVNGQHTCPNLHLVLQSGSNEVLKRMNRKYTREVFIDCVDQLIQKNRDFTFTTDVIVGFPSESDRDFEDTLSVIRQVKFAKVHIFPYSVRSQTRASLFLNHVDLGIIQDRKTIIQRVADQTAFDLREHFLHRSMDVLLEEGNDECLNGHTGNFLHVQVPRGSHRANELVSVELVENGAEGFIGRIL